jgi:hypothetical protein
MAPSATGKAAGQARCRPSASKHPRRALGTDRPLASRHHSEPPTRPSDIQLRGVVGPARPDLEQAAPPGFDPRWHALSPTRYGGSTDPAHFRLYEDSYRRLPGFPGWAGPPCSPATCLSCRAFATPGLAKCFARIFNSANRNHPQGLGWR